MGNECNCLDYQVNEKETELWISSIESAIRLADDTRPVYSGMHGARVQGPWNLLVQSKYLDMMTTHPYRMAKKVETVLKDVLRTA